MKRNRKIVFIVGLLFLFVIFLSRCINASQKTEDKRGSTYAGAASCRQCHQSIYDSALVSAHYNASAAASKNNIHGSFDKGKNIFRYDSVTKIVMESRDSGLFQVLYKNEREIEAHRFDIGFGVQHAQTWLYWSNKNTYELPVSFYTSLPGWATSPGFAATQPDFKRLIGKDCFECHSSNINSTQKASAGNYFANETTAELLDEKSLVYGIDCERCHGAAASHVAFHIDNPEIKTAKFIVTKNSLSQQQQLDMCAVCHSGNDKIKLKSRFKFKLGDTLTNFFLNASIRTTSTNFDVHGNQFGLLSQSKCFLKSNTMNCATCHSPHTNANQSVIVYSQKCMSCHNEASQNFCSNKATSVAILKENCIDCHMPKQSSGAISFQVAGSTKESAYFLRTHRISVYATNHNLNESAIKKHQ
jgi:predicted CXXCH cytochrome family protein